MPAKVGFNPFYFFAPIITLCVSMTMMGVFYCSHKFIDMLNYVASQLSGWIMLTLEVLVPLREYCRNHKWPRLPQWNHWIYSKALIAKVCVKKIGGRYLIDMAAFQEYVENATLEEVKQTKGELKE